MDTKRNKKDNSETYTLTDNPYNNPVKRYSESSVLKLQLTIHHTKQKLMQSIYSQQKLSTLAELKKCEYYLKQLKQYLVRKHLGYIQKCKSYQSDPQKPSNDILTAVKKRIMLQRNKMESALAYYKQEEWYIYQNELYRRRKKMRSVTLEKIKYKYLTSKTKGEKTYKTSKTTDYDYRLKTEVNNKYYSRDYSSRFLLKVKYYFRNNKIKALMRKYNLREMIMRRKEYGNKMEIMVNTKPKIKHKKMVEENYYCSLGKVIDKYDYRKSNKKAQLDSNVHGAIDHEAEIRRITNTNLPIIDKMQRLNFLADSYNLKCEQGKTEALSLLCQVSLARANIFLSAQ